MREKRARQVTERRGRATGRHGRMRRRARPRHTKTGRDGQICGRFRSPLAEIGRNAVFNWAESRESSPLVMPQFTKPQFRKSPARSAPEEPVIANRITRDFSQRTAKSTAHLMIPATIAKMLESGTGQTCWEAGQTGPGGVRSLRGEAAGTGRRPLGSKTGTGPPGGKAPRAAGQRQGAFPPASDAQPLGRLRRRQQFRKQGHELSLLFVG